MDQAVATFGTALEVALNEVKGKNDRDVERGRKQVLERWLQDEKDAAASAAERERELRELSAPASPAGRGR